MVVEFTKMHGAGNDFVVVDEWSQGMVPESQKPDFVVKLCRRHFGVGADGLIFVQKSEAADASFVFYNPDGSRAEMCGNGIRCFAKYLYDRGYVRKKVMEVESLAGLVKPEVIVEDGAVSRVRVDMGAPRIKRKDIPVAGELDSDFVDLQVYVGDELYRVTAVGMGNPHAVLFVEDVDGVDVKFDGSRIRYHTELFPKGANVHFVQRLGGSEFRIRSYERGVEDETLACGTGVCASAVAAVLNKKAKAGKPLLFHARGGDLTIELETKGADIHRIYMTGPAEEVYRGIINLGMTIL